MSRHAITGHVSLWRACGLFLTAAVVASAPPAVADADPATGQISGTVSLDPPLTPAALSFAGVSAWSLGPVREQPTFSNSDAVAPDGSFVIADLPPGEYLVATLGAFARLWYPEAPDPADAAPVQVVAGQTTDVGDIAEQIGTTVIGTVVNPQGRPVANAYVMATMRAPDGPGYADQGAQTNPSGAYSIPNVPAGRWSLTIPFRARYVPTARTVTTTGFGTVDVDFVLRAKRRTRLRALTIKRRGSTLRVSARTNNRDLLLPGAVRVLFGTPAAPRARRLGILFCRQGRCAGRFRLPAAAVGAAGATLAITLPGDRTRTTVTVTRALWPG